MSDDVSDEEIAGLGLESLAQRIVGFARAHAAEERDDFEEEDRERARTKVKRGKGWLGNAGWG